MTAVGGMGANDPDLAAATRATNLPGGSEPRLPALTILMLASFTAALRFGIALPLLPFWIGTSDAEAGTRARTAALAGPFVQSRMTPSRGAHPSSVPSRVRSSDQMRSSDQSATSSSGLHCRYKRVTVSDRMLKSANPRSCRL